MYTRENTGMSVMWDIGLVRSCNNRGYHSRQPQLSRRPLPQMIPCSQSDVMQGDLGRTILVGQLVRLSRQWAGIKKDEYE